MAPPKRKTGGRTTPKGTTPGQSKISTEAKSTSGVAASSRYTPRITEEMRHSPRWLPILMSVLFGIGAVLILTRYLFDTPQWMVFAGLGAIMGGLYCATKWH